MLKKIFRKNKYEIIPSEIPTSSFSDHFFKMKLTDKLFRDIIVIITDMKIVNDQFSFRLDFDFVPIDKEKFLDQNEELFKKTVKKNIIHFIEKNLGNE